MRKLVILMLLAAAGLGILAGCRADSEDASTAYQVYFTARSGSFGDAALVSEVHHIEDAAAEPLTELLRLLLKGPESEGLRAIIPTGVTVQDWSLDDGVLTVDFSSRYGALSGIDLTLADYSVTMTLSQLPEVTSVVTTVEGSRITYRNHQHLKLSDILLSIYRSQPELRQVALFFPKKDQTGLEEEGHTISLTEDASLTMAVLHALAGGPKDDKLAGVLSEMEILSAEIEDGICSLDLAAAFYELAPEEEGADRLIIYALVNTLCGLDSITAVRFQVEGEAASRYGALYLGEALEFRDVAISPTG